MADSHPRNSPRSRPGRVSRRIARLASAGCAIGCLLTGLTAGCGGTATARVDEANNRLRHEVVELEDRIAALEAERNELATKLERMAAAEAQTDAESAFAALPAELPVAQDVAVGRSAHARDDDGDGLVDRVYAPVSTVDGRGRFVQVAATLTVRAAVLPDVDDGEPMQAGRVELDPAALRDAYRTGIAGAHYAVWIPIDPGAAPVTESGKMLITIRLEDRLTGAELRADRMIELRNAVR